MPRLPHINELSPTVLAVEESKKGFTIDLAKVSGIVGDKVVVFGNLDATQVAKWSNAELERELQCQLDAARPARGFVFSMGSPFPLDTPRERVAAFIRIAQGLT